MKLPRLLLFLTLSLCSIAFAQQSTDTKQAPGILNRDEAAAVMPATVFYRGQTAPVQARNSAGVRSSDGKLMLTALVDTSGYSFTTAQTYQAYLITEFPLHIGAHTLAPGAYGFGFVDGNRMVVQDLGGNKLFEATTTHDAKIVHPTPLQIVADGSGYRLYLARSFVAFSVAGH